MFAQQPVIIIGKRSYSKYCATLCVAISTSLVKSAKVGTCVQIVRRLPVAAAGYLGARRDDVFDFGFQLGVEGHGIRWENVEDPERRGKKFLDFLLYFHAGDYSLIATGARALQPVEYGGNFRSIRDRQRAEIERAQTRQAGAGMVRFRADIPSVLVVIEAIARACGPRVSPPAAMTPMRSASLIGHGSQAPFVIHRLAGSSPAWVTLLSVVSI